MTTFLRCEWGDESVSDGREDGVARDSHLATQERVVGLVGALLDDGELSDQELEDLDELRAVNPIVGARLCVASPL